MSFLRRLFFMLTTLRTEKWLRRVFSTLCCLDLDTKISLNGARLLAAGNTVEIENGNHLRLSETIDGEVKVDRVVAPTSETKTLYVTDNKNFWVDTLWVWKLKRLHKDLRRMQIYKERQKLLNSKDPLEPFYL